MSRRKRAGQQHDGFGPRDIPVILAKSTTIFASAGARVDAADLVIF